MPNAFQLAEATAAASARLRGNGRTIEQSTNFAEIHREIVDMEKGRISPEMSWLHNDLTSANAFYVIVRNEEGQIIAVCAARHYQLNQENLVSFLQRQYARLYGHGESAIDATLMPPLAHEIKGSVCYFGDFFIAREGRVSKQFNNSDFVVLVYGLAIMQFDPDWVFAFLRQKSVLRGLSAVYLTSRCYPCALEWTVDEHHPADWLIGSSRNDLHYLFDLITRDRLRSINSVGLVENTSGSPQRQSSSEPAVRVART
ncbi:MAG: hypothetical protein AAGD13_22660 [Pseudomonadota bacterium]